MQSNSETVELIKPNCFRKKNKTERRPNGNNLCETVQVGLNK